MEARIWEDIRRDIESTKKRLKDVEISVIEKKEGLYFICVPEDFKVIFQKETTGPEEIDGKSTLVSEISLNNHYNKKSNYLLVGQGKNLHLAVKKFLSYGNIIEKAYKDESKLDRVIWQIKDSNELYIGYHYSADSMQKKKDFLEFHKKEYGILIGNRQFKTNDAIASWSGFNYQGKVTILRIVQHINQLIREFGVTSIGNYLVELEKTEDFVIYENDDPIEFYQVKAKLTSFTSASYKDAIENLILNKGENSDSSCFLISAAKIVDWNQKESNGVSLYEYDSMSNIEMKDVPRFIKKELVAYFTNKGDNLKPFEIDYMYNDICVFLDDKIADIHSKKERKNYSIEYREILDILEKNANELKENVDAKIKEEVYDFISERFNHAITDFCTDCQEDNRNPNIHCIECALNPLRDNLSQMNYEKYAQILLFHEEKMGGSYNPIVALNTANLHSLFVEFMYADVDLLELHQDYNLINLKDEKIIPTEMNFENGASSSLSRAFERMRGNYAVHDLISGKTLTAKINTESQLEYLQNLITEHSESEECLSEYESKDSITEKLNFKIIDREILIKKLKERKHEK
ncbi:hypothetical protein [Listeria booriae]|uniref:hypothetical protein n=1 Tax=Listeria booriae TaxID=1552123 RepID=UPI001627B350|nr:hypothetical protein [Listeria booriae]MBC2196608.1 hypothetical protein [Listeria booriae]